MMTYLYKVNFIIVLVGSILDHFVLEGNNNIAFLKERGDSKNSVSVLKSWNSFISNLLSPPKFALDLFYVFGLLPDVILL